MIAQAIVNLRPGAQWALNGDTLAGLDWLDASQQRPTDAEILAEVERLENYIPADAVRAEASRRLQIMFGARNDAHLNMIISNATREAVRLQNIKLAGQEWTTEQATRAAQLVAADAAVEAVRAASNAMEPNPPADYADDRHWPAI